jgi:hypothetical protein
VEFGHVHVTKDGAIAAAEIGLSETAVRHGLAADEDVPHGAIMALGTDSCTEIDAGARFGALFGADVDLESE